MNFKCFCVKLSFFESTFDYTYSFSVGIRSVFSARQHICYSVLYAIASQSVHPSVRPSVHPSVTRVDRSKTVEARITQPLPQSSPMTSFLMRNFTMKFQREDRERGCRIREGYGYEKYAMFSH